MRSTEIFLVMGRGTYVTILLVFLLLFFSLVVFRQHSVRVSARSCSLAIPRSGAGISVLVTGAAGFIGSHVAQACAQAGMRVIGVDDMSGGFYENIIKHEKVTFIKGDVKDAHAMENVFRTHGPFDFVYHLAAYAAEGLSHFIPSYNYRNNLVGSVEILSLAVKNHVKCFIFTSSIAVYGAVSQSVTEKIEPKPEDPYGISKYAMELHLKSAHEMHGIKFIIFRPHNVYGPHQNIADKYRNVVGIFMTQILLNQPLTIFGDGQQTRSFSYIDDVAPVIAKAPLHEHAHNQIFNVGADEPYTLIDLAKHVSVAMTGKAMPVTHLPPRLEVVHSQISNDKVRCFFHLGPPTDLQTGLNRTADWVRTAGRTYGAVAFPAVEIVSHIPPSWKRVDLKELAHIEHTSSDNPRALEYEKLHP